MNVKQAIATVNKHAKECRLSNYSVHFENNYGHSLFVFGFIKGRPKWLWDVKDENWSDDPDTIGVVLQAKVIDANNNRLVATYYPAAGDAFYKPN